MGSWLCQSQYFDAVRPHLIGDKLLRSSDREVGQNLFVHDAQAKLVN
jgi:hypothetical protein